MKFGKEFTSQMVPEWQEAYMDYNFLKNLLKDISNFRQRKAPINPVNPKGSNLKRRGSFYRAFSGLTNTLKNSQQRENEDEVILVNSVENEGSEGHYCQTMFLKSSDDGGEFEFIFFRRLDEEFNKVVKFHRGKVDEVLKEAEELNKQMDALIALRIKVDKPQIGSPTFTNVATTNDFDSASAQIHPSINGRKPGVAFLDVIREVEMSSEGNTEDEVRETNEPKNTNYGKYKEKTDLAGFRPAPLEVLDQVRINVDPETPVSTLKKVLMLSKSEFSFTKKELSKVEEQMRKAFIEFHQQLRLLKSYCFLNQLAFSKIMKKYDKITTRSASKAYLQMVDKSYLGSSDEVTRLIERVEATFIKHFSNGNRRKGMNKLRPTAKKERHRITFFMGLLFGCSLALIVAIGITIQARNLIRHPGRGDYMNNIFPLYSLFGFIVLHMLMYSGNIYYWRRFRINYPFIFGFKQGTELGYREVLLVSSGLALLALAGVLSNLDMELEPGTKSYATLTELVPLGLLSVVLLITFSPFNFVYRSSRFFLIKCGFHSLLAPLYKVTLPDFFLADQLTSQVQAFRSLQFYICYYAWGDFTKRLSRCHGNDVFDIFSIIVAVIPYWFRFLQCFRRLIDERDSAHVFNGLKYLSTIVAVVMRTGNELNWGPVFKLIALITSIVATIANTYWDIVVDWGLLRRNSRNPWLRDKLLVPSKSVYFVAIVLNVLLRLAWMQSVMGVTEVPFLHKKALIALVACLEIIRRGIWNFFRLENEHLNNVGKYRAFKSVPLPFNYGEVNNKSA